MTPLLAAAAALIGVTLSGRTSMGHACPVSPTTALTAEHVSTFRHRTGKDLAIPLVYMDGPRWGVVREVRADLTRDLSLLQLLRGDPFAVTYILSGTEPKAGDEVTLEGYDFEKGMTRKVIKAKIRNVGGSFITYDKNGGPGSSGSCVLNEAGELIAINTGYFETLNEVGIGVSVWGPWQEFFAPEGEP